MWIVVPPLLSLRRHVVCDHRSLQRTHEERAPVACQRPIVGTRRVGQWKWTLKHRRQAGDRRDLPPDRTVSVVERVDGAVAAGCDHGVPDQDGIAGRSGANLWILRLRKTDPPSLLAGNRIE